MVSAIKIILRLKTTKLQVRPQEERERRVISCTRGICRKVSCKHKAAVASLVAGLSPLKNTQIRPPFVKVQEFEWVAIGNVFLFLFLSRKAQNLFRAEPSAWIAFPVR